MHVRCAIGMMPTCSRYFTLLAHEHPPSATCSLQLPFNVRCITAQYNGQWPALAMAFGRRL
jgi:hypothetical protein